MGTEMASKARIDYYFWIVSDWAYFGHPRLEQLADRHGVGIHYMPVDLPYVYSRTGGILLHQRAKERQDYRIAELIRFRDLLRIPLNIEPKYFPANGNLASRVVIAAKDSGLDLGRLVPSIMRALWAEDRDIADRDTLVTILNEQGCDGTDLLRAAEAEDVERTYRRFTDDAIERGVFGSPFYFFEGERFWGQDRLEHLERAILKSRWKNPADVGRSPGDA
jgi:2-hydroxychromene-2-carboxylate isomerase